MDSGNAERPSPGLQAALAGLQAGMVAALVMLLWLGLSSAWYRHTFWMPPNLMASNFYGDAVVRPGFSYATLSGIAVYLLVYSLFGAAFGRALYTHGSRLRIFLLAVLVSLVWYYLWWGWLWPKLNPLMALYTHDRPMLVAHALFGVWLGRFPAYLPKPAPSPVELPAAEVAGPEKAKP